MIYDHVMLYHGAVILNMDDGSFKAMLFFPYQTNAEALFNIFISTLILNNNFVLVHILFLSTYYY